MELLRFFHKGGTTNEYFEDYFSHCVEEMKRKYPTKTLIFVMDNLLAHKSAYIMRLIQDERVGILYTPSNTPE